MIHWLLFEKREFELQRISEHSISTIEKDLDMIALGPFNVKNKRVIHHKGRKFTVTILSTPYGEHFVRSIRHYGSPSSIDLHEAAFTELEEAFEIAEDEGRAAIDARAA